MQAERLNTKVAITHGAIPVKSSPLAVNSADSPDDNRAISLTEAAASLP